MQFEKIIRDESLGFATFETAVEHLGKLHGCSRANAMSMVAAGYPDLLRKYNDEGEERVQNAALEATQKRAPSPATQDWEMLVSGIMGRDRVSRAVAMQRARRENMGAYAAFQTDG